MRLDKFLTANGIGTRTEVKKIIKQGRIHVNEKIIKKPDTHIDEFKDIVSFDEEQLHYEPFVYLMLNKPAGVISATEDRFHSTVLDLVTGYQHYDLHPVGRLDIDTEGLLILTNDGRFSHEVLSPKKHVNKTYYAEIDGCVTNETIAQFKNGVVLDDGYKTMPATLVIKSSGEQSQIELTIQEGKFHQVKRMFLAVDMKVTYLKRIKMGSLELDESIQPGQFKKLNESEIILAKK